MTGKILLIVRHGPDDDEAVRDECPDDGLCTSDVQCLWDFSYKAKNALRHGAVAMILVQHLDGPAGVAELGPLALGATDDAPFLGLFADREVMTAVFPELQTRIGEIDDTLSPRSVATGFSATLSVSTSHATITTENVLGALVGTDPELSSEVVVVGGHIDHVGVDATSGAIYPGADDNASGAAVTLEVARTLSACTTPARTVLFALWNGEEEGLFGSLHYVSNPVYPLSSTVAAYSIDMVGAGDASGVGLYGATDPSSSWLYDVMVDTAAATELRGTITPMAPVEEFGMASDHVPFGEVGIPNLLVETLGDHRYYHTPEDTIDTITAEDLGMATSLSVAGMRPLVEGTEERSSSAAAAR